MFPAIQVRMAKKEREVKQVTLDSMVNVGIKALVDLQVNPVTLDLSA